MFQQGHEANEALEILKNDGPEAAVNYLAQWHDPGHQETSQTPGHGTMDNVYRVGPYILSANPPYEYIGLVFDTQAQ